MRLLARMGLSLFPVALASLSTAFAPLVTGCANDGGGSPPQPTPATNADDTCLAALGSADEDTACAGSPLKAIADAQLQFTRDYLNGRDQCATMDVDPASDCYASSQCTLLQTLRDTEAAVLPAIPDDRGTGRVCQ
jgi:hypothetical protein